jgi:two-component system phosphate regulon response regulator PhoB
MEMLQLCRIGVTGLWLNGAFPAMNPCILIADDEPDILGLLRGNLLTGGFEVLEASDGPTALEVALRHVPAAVVLDCEMPGLSGVEVCQALKADGRTSQMGVLMLSGCRQEADRVRAFEAGVDDYVTKPFSPREVVLRLRAILRRAEQPPAPSIRTLSAGGIALDLDQHQVTVEGREVSMTPIEFKILRAMLQKRDLLLSREALLAAVWGGETEVEPRTIDTHLRRLREKLGGAARQISTVRGFGYRLRAA